MRILYYSHTYGSVTTTFIRSEVEYFSRTHDVRYLCLKTQLVGKVPSYVDVLPFEENVLVKKCRWLLWKFDLACTFQSTKYSVRLKDYVDRFNPDIIHCHFGYESLTLLDNIEYSKYKIVLHFHGYDATQLTRKRSYLARLGELLKMPNVFALVCCRYFRERLAQYTGHEEQRFRVLYYGIDTDTFQPNRIGQKANSEKKFVQISSLMPKKGHDFTLAAFARLRSIVPDLQCKLVLTGDGQRKEQLIKLAAKLAISEDVSFVGNVTQHQAVQLLNEADVFVHHSITDINGDMEGIPNSIIEAMAMELPIVSTRHSGIPELVEEGENGYLVEEGNIEDYARKMLMALHLGTLRKSRRKVLSVFNINTHNQDLEGFYKSILQKRSIQYVIHR